jgi:hypothetical protein
MTDAEIASLSSADKLVLAQRLLQSLASELDAKPIAASSAPARQPLSSAELSGIQASLALQVHTSLKTHPAETDWNAVRRTALGTEAGKVEK